MSIIFYDHIHDHYHPYIYRGDRSDRYIYDAAIICSNDRALIVVIVDEAFENQTIKF
jgi:hypothetical protein